MPETKKGTKIKKAMQQQYGKKAGERVFYASANKGTVEGVHKAKPASTKPASKSSTKKKGK